MQYREHTVPPHLRRHVAALWHLCDPAPAAGPQTIYPDGCCELIAHLGEPPRGWDAERGWHDQAPTLFAAQHLGPVRLLAAPPLECVGLRLQPEASAMLGGGTLVRDRVLDLAQIDPVLSEALLTAARSFAKGDAAALWPLVERHAASWPVDASVSRAVALIRDSAGAARIDRLARELGLSQRSLQTRFRACVGLTPKEFARIMRLRATLQALDSSDAALSELAADAGFADQAHATRELRKVTGLPPARLRAALRQDRGGELAIRLAAAFVRGGA